MKRSLSLLIILCLLAALLSGCAGAEPSPAPVPEQSPVPEETASPGESVAPESGEVVVVTDTPPAAETPAEPGEPLPEELALVFALPTANSPEELVYYFSPSEEFDCGFAYPSWCASWVEKGAIRLSPSWFFARMFFTSVFRDAETAPDELLDLLETGKWGTYADEGTAGSGWRALRALHLKYDTWRRWVAWETPDRYYLLYGSCFDGREEDLVSVFETVADSFRTGEELLRLAPEQGTLLRQDKTLGLFFDGAELCGGNAPCVLLRLRAVNTGADACTLAVSAYTADGQTFPCDAALELPAGEEQVWTLTLPLTSGDDGALFESLGFWVSAQSGADSLFELPVRIELNG